MLRVVLHQPVLCFCVPPAHCFHGTSDSFLPTIQANSYSFHLQVLLNAKSPSAVEINKHLNAHWGNFVHIASVSFACWWESGGGGNSGEVHINGADILCDDRSVKGKRKPSAMRVMFSGSFGLHYSFLMKANTIWKSLLIEGGDLRKQTKQMKVLLPQ